MGSVVRKRKGRNDKTRRGRRGHGRGHRNTQGSRSSIPVNDLGVVGAIIGASAFGQMSSESDGNDNNNNDNNADMISMSGGRNNHTKGFKSKSLDVSVLILTFMEMLNTIKIFHWSTLSYPSHKATDDLHTKLSEFTDAFIEQYIGGIGGGKIPVFHGRDVGNKSIPFCECKSLDMFKSKLGEYKTFLISLTDKLNDVTELLNIRDEMIGAIDQTVYLLRLK